jgi:hypothetical protein
VSRSRELRLSPNGCTVCRGADELQRDSRSRDHLTADIQDAMHAGNAALEVSTLLMDRGCEQEIANRVSTRCARFSWESKAQKIGCSGLCVREGNEAVPQVAYGRDSELLAQHSRGTAVIAHGDDRGEMCGLEL